MSVLKTYSKPENAVSKTYKLENKRISGKIDGKAAVAQAIELAITAERWRFPIFSGDYGCELEGLFEQDDRPSRERIRLMLEDTLLEDDRISAVEDVFISFKGDVATISFTAVTEFGNVNAERSVSIG